MRNAFSAVLCELARQDPRIIFLVSDIGNITFDSFRKEFPDRFLNVGVAEASMVGVSAGLALCGKIPITYTIASFQVMRAFEQIRDDVCYQNLPVKIVGVGGGLAYSTLGPTHHTIEDVAMLRAIPNMTIVCPADPIEARLAAFAVVEHDGPVYVRLAKAGEPALYKAEYLFKIGTAVQMAEGSDATVIATGLVVGNTLAAAERLRQRGFHVRVINMHTLKPLDRSAVVAAAQETGAIVTVEEHSVFGGLGSAVAEVLAEHGVRVALKRLGLADRFCHDYGSQSYLLQQAGLGPDAIVSAVEEVLARRGR